MKVSALYGDRLSTSSQENIVKIAERNQENLASTTRNLKENRERMAAVNESTRQAVSKAIQEDATVSKGVKAVVASNQHPAKSEGQIEYGAVNNTAVEQMMGIGRNFDVMLSDV